MRVPCPWHAAWRGPTIVPMESLDDVPPAVPALRTSRLGRRYGRVWGLRECTLEVPAGVVAALVGPNGAGKTTLLEMVIGLLEPTEGQVSVFGKTSRAGTAQTLARSAMSPRTIRCTATSLSRTCCTWAGR
jgi:ABC-type branched-subunit amino acid transport system ATPase component